MHNTQAELLRKAHKADGDQAETQPKPPAAFTHADWSAMCYSALPSSTSWKNQKALHEELLFLPFSLSDLGSLPVLF